jgi:hypothetical protein
VAKETRVDDTGVVANNDVRSAQILWRRTLYGETPETKKDHPLDHKSTDNALVYALGFDVSEKQAGNRATQETNSDTQNKKRVKGYCCKEFLDDRCSADVAQPTEEIQNEEK